MGTGALGRPHLVLVPTGHDAVRAARAAQQAQPPLRLTPFGRLVFSLLAAAALALLLSVFAGSLASASGEAQEITVRAGQTLSGIAAEHLPGLPIRDAVVELQVFNGLSSSNIHVGQTLLIPSP
jgi:LysM repeat protein